MSFITSFWKSGIQSQSDRDAQMRLRVAEYVQKILKRKRISSRIELTLLPPSLLLASLTVNHRTSINAQKIVDGFASPEITISHCLQEPRIYDTPMYGVAHADLKYATEGTRSTFAAAQAEAAANKARRDQLLQKYK